MQHLYLNFTALITNETCRKKKIEKAVAIARAPLLWTSYTAKLLYWQQDFGVDIAEVFVHWGI